MAKAKKASKSEPTTETPIPAATPQAAKPAVQATPATSGKSKAKSAAKPAAAPTPAAPKQPVFDTTHAVAAAAALVASGHSNSNATVSNLPQKETANFKQLKESLNKSHSKNIGGLLDKTPGASGKKSSQPFSPFGKQVGHNQTFGADVNRSGVPRRTGG